MFRPEKGVDELVARVLEIWRETGQRAAGLPPGSHKQTRARWAADELRRLHYALAVERMPTRQGLVELRRIALSADLVAED